MDYYYDVVIQVAQEYPVEIVVAQHKKLVAEFNTDRLSGLKPFVDAFVKCVELYRHEKEAKNIECMKYFGMSN